jgi:hypothetical protein
MSATRETPVTESGYDSDVVYRRPRRRRGGWVTMLAILLVLVAIAVVGDRLAARYATTRLRTQLVAELDSRGVGYDTTEVSIGGFPFVNQVARGRYDSITIDMTGVRLPTGNGNQTALVPTLHAVARSVVANPADVVKGTAKVTAEQVDGTALVAFSTLETLVDYRQFNLSNVRFSEVGGALKATGTVNIAGAQLPIAATADIVVVRGQLQVHLRDASAVGLPAPDAARTYLSRLAERSLAARMPALPFGLRLDKVTVEPAGLAVSASGRNVALVS